MVNWGEFFERGVYLQLNKIKILLSWREDLNTNDYRLTAPPVLRDFLVYHETIQGHSRKTVDEYYLDCATSSAM